MTIGPWLELPGPRSFFGSILEDLRGGSSVVVHLPEHAPASVSAALHRQLSCFEAYQLRCLDLAALGGCQESPARFLHRQLAPLDAGTTCSTKSLTEDLRSTGWLLWPSGLDARSWPRWRDFLAEYAHASRSRTPRERSVFVVCLPGDKWGEPPDGDVALSIRRWTGVMSRVDIQLLISGIVVERVPDPLLRRVAAAVVVELAAFDAQLALELCARNIELLMSPFELLRECGRARGWRPTDDPHSWGSGRRDIFEGVELSHSAWLALAGDLDEITSRVWQGQVGSLFPFLEEQRRRLIRRHTGQLRVPMETKAGGVIDDVRELELGHVLHQLRKGRVGNDELAAIEALNEARHALAHFEPVGAPLLRRCAATRGRFAR